MIHLHTLGDALITVGEKEIRPSSPMVFAALLYLGVERGRRVPRAALQELLFPESDERSGSHSMRQLLYKLRQLGAPLHTDATSVGIDGNDVRDRMAELDSAPAALLRSGFLPAYQSNFSESFGAWVSTARDHNTARIIRALVDRMTRAYAAGAEVEALELAIALLEHDPLNEEATLTKAKLLAAVGRKQNAVDVLAEYSAEVSTELRLPAEVLRKRIQFDAGRLVATTPLVGRDFELQQLVTQHRRATSGTTTVSLLWGDAGIGKTRLAQEMAARVSIDGTRVVWAFCQAHTLARPLGALTDFVRSLMKCRGALGVSPRSMEWLRKLELRADDEALPTSLESKDEISREISEAVLDLLACVSSEGPLLLILEDAQWLDDPSRDFLLQRLAPKAKLHLVITSRDSSIAALKTAYGDSLFVRKLEPLKMKAAEELLIASLPQRVSTDAPLVDDCVALASGNPLFLRTLAHHIASCGDLPSAKARIPDLMLQRIHPLAPTSLLLLRQVAVLGNLGTIDRIRDCLALTDLQVMLAIQDLSDRGLVTTQHDSLVCSHQILIDTVLSNAPLPLLKALYEKAAICLEAEGRVTHEASLLWSCAELWLRCSKPTRAASVLRQCGSFAVDLGQPRYALPALERAQELSLEVDLPTLVNETIRVADWASDDEAVLRNVDKYRRLALNLSTDLLHFSELAELRALRRLGKDIWNQRDRMVRFALAPGAPITDRRRAARTFLASAEENFGSEEVLAVASSLETLWADEEAIDALELRMLFHLIAGDMSALRGATLALLQRINDVPLLVRPVTMSAMARCLLAAGDATMAMEISAQEIALARSNNRATDLAMAYARLTDCNAAIGNLAQARHWLEQTEAIVGEFRPALAYHLLNRTVLAISAADFGGARDAIERLKAEDEAAKPHLVRCIVGLELLLHSAAGCTDSQTPTLPELLALDDVGGHHSEHLHFAAGLFCLLVSRGEVAQAFARFGDYVARRRRERFDLWPALSLLRLRPEQLQLMQRAALQHASAPPAQALTDRRLSSFMPTIPSSP